MRSTAYAKKRLAKSIDHDASAMTMPTKCVFRDSTASRAEGSATTFDGRSFSRSFISCGAP
jgi:hypothetical protein